MSKFWKWFVTSLDKLFVIKFTLIMQTQDQPSIVDSRRKAVRWRKPATQKAMSSLCVFGCLMFISLSERVGTEMRRSLREVCTVLWILSASEWSEWGSPPHRTPPPAHTHSTAAGGEPGGIPLPPTIPGSEADFLLVPPLLSPLCLQFSFSGLLTICFSSAKVVFRSPWEKLWDI